MLCGWCVEHNGLYWAGPKSEIKAKMRAVSVIDQVLAILGQPLQGLLFGSLDWLLRLRVRVLELCMIRPLAMCIMSFLGLHTNFISFP